MKGHHGWKPGPLPPNTSDCWGGVVTKDIEGIGFYFATFWGDHAQRGDGKRVEAADVLWYNNSIGIPPGCEIGSCKGG